MSAAPQPFLTPKRILVVTLADLGDALLTTPALQTLRAAQPHAHITILTTPVGMAALRDQPLYDEIIVFEKQRFNRPQQLLRPNNLIYAARLWRQLRQQPFDACLILHHLTTWFGALKYAALAFASGAQRRYGRDNGRGFFLTDRVPDPGFGEHHQTAYWLAIVALLGGHGTPTPTFQVNAPDQRTAALLLADHVDGNRPLVAMHPGAGQFAPARKWSPTRFAALADALIEDGVQVVLVGGAEEAPLRQTVLGAMQYAAAIRDLGGRTSLGELGAVLQRCTLFVGNDSGVAHLAGSVGIPVVALFGPTDVHAWGPYGGASWENAGEFPNGVAVLHSGQHRALQATIACSPCIYRGHTLGTPHGCPDRTCLHRIDVAQPLALIRQRLRELSGELCA